MTIAPDTATRYLSTELFAGDGHSMQTADEWDLDALPPSSYAPDVRLRTAAISGDCIRVTNC